MIRTLTISGIVMFLNNLKLHILCKFVFATNTYTKRLLKISTSKNNARLSEDGINMERRASNKLH